MVTKFIASEHSINYWPFGNIGYGYDYRKRKFQWIGEVIAPCFIYAIFSGFLFSITMFASTLDMTLQPILPMNSHFMSNVINEMAKNQGILCALNMFCPVYPFGISRVIFSLMYPKRSAKEISTILMIPTVFSGMVSIGGAIYLWAPYLLFPGIWCIYQSILWFTAIKKKAISSLPLYQTTEEKFSFTVNLDFG